MLRLLVSTLKSEEFYLCIRCINVTEKTFIGVAEVLLWVVTVLARILDKTLIIISALVGSSQGLDVTKASRPGSLGSNSRYAIRFVYHSGSSIPTLIGKVIGEY